jgi:hypothetical protein
MALYGHMVTYCQLQCAYIWSHETIRLGFRLRAEGRVCPSGAQNRIWRRTGRRSVSRGKSERPTTPSFTRPG